MNVEIYAEGGGDARELKARFRKALQLLLEKAGFKGHMPGVRACGSRKSAYDIFLTAHADRGEDDFPILLVDSEELVSKSPWKHLEEQPRDLWKRPADAHDEQAHLMVTCMETWIVADRAALRKVFGQHLNESALPPEAGLEGRTKGEIQGKLEVATKACPRGRRYEKGRRSFQVVGELDPGVLEPLLPHFERLLDTLRDRL